MPGGSLSTPRSESEIVPSSSACASDSGYRARLSSSTDDMCFNALWLLAAFLSLDFLVERQHPYVFQQRVAETCSAPLVSRVRVVAITSTRSFGWMKPPASRRWLNLDRDGAIAGRQLRGHEAAAVGLNDGALHDRLALQESAPRHRANHFRLLRGANELWIDRGAREQTRR